MPVKYPSFPKPFRTSLWFVYAFLYARSSSISCRRLERSMERVLLRRCDLFLADIDPEACGPRPSPMACLAEFLRLRRIFRHTGQTNDLDWATTSALHRQYRSRGGSGEADPTPVRDEGSDGSALRLRGDTRTVRALPRVVGAAEEEAQRPIRLSALFAQLKRGPRTVVGAAAFAPEER